MTPARTGPRLYGRLVAHGGLTPVQKQRLECDFPKFSLGEDGPALDLGALCEPGQPIWIDIGFGAGEHLIWQAQRNPDVVIIGVEPFLTGVAKCIAAIQDAGATNVRLCAGDARRFIARLPDSCIARVFLLHPDPWPKWRHAKRRLVQPGFLDDLARVMVPGAQFRVGTDWPDYSAWTLFHVMRHPDFVWRAAGPTDWRQRPADWTETRYARKAKKQGRRDVHLTFERTA